MFFIEFKRTKKEKGFTLIEIMIVVAIIGILAAIAIPQFSSYQIKAFNGAAVYDVRNLILAESSLFADYKAYGTSTLYGDVGLASGVLISGSGKAISTGIATEDLSFSLSNNVNLVVTSNFNFNTYTITSKHTRGDRVIAFDNDVIGLKWGSTGFPQGYKLKLSDAFGASLGNDVTTLNSL